MLMTWFCWKFLMTVSFFRRLIGVFRIWWWYQTLIVECIVCDWRSTFFEANRKNSILVTSKVKASCRRCNLRSVILSLCGKAPCTPKSPSVISRLNFWTSKTRQIQTSCNWSTTLHIFSKIFIALYPAYNKDWLAFTDWMVKKDSQILFYSEAYIIFRSTWKLTSHMNMKYSLIVKFLVTFSYNSCPTF